MEIGTQVLILKDVATGQTFRGWDFLKVILSLWLGFVDEDQIPDLLKFLDFLETVDTEIPQNHAEYRYLGNDVGVVASYESQV